MAYSVCVYSYRQEQTPASPMGCIGGITGTLFRLGMPVVMYLSGWVIAWWGAPVVFLASALANLVIFAIYLRSPLWRVR